MIEATITDRPKLQYLTAVFGYRIKTVLVAALIGWPVSLVYYLRLDDVIGQVRDDAWYVLLAKSLATGQGYQLLNAPMAGIFPSYPPAFPFLLSLLLRVLPAAAEQLWLLKSVSIVAMLTIGWVTYLYLSSCSDLPKHLAAAVATAVTIMPAFVFLATSTVMSECVFTLGQLLTVFVIEKALRQGGSPTVKNDANTIRFLSFRYPQQGYWVLAATLAAFTFLTRSVAVTLVAAVVLYLLKERQRKAVIIFAGCTALLILPWLLYARWQAPTLEQKQMHGGYILYSYGEQFWMKRAGDTESGTETWRDLPARIGKNTYNIVAHDLCGLVLPSVLRDAAESGEEVLGIGELGGGKRTSMGQVTATQMVSLSLTLLVLIGFFSVVRRRVSLAEILLLCSLALIVIWPWLTFRFLLPLAPFLLHYLLQGLATVARWGQRINDEWALPRICMLCVLALYAYDQWGYLKQIRQSPEAVSWRAEFTEVQASLDWARQHLPADAIVAANNPAQFYLYTGRKAVTSSHPKQNWERWRTLGVRYLVILSSHSGTQLDDEPFPLIYGGSPEQMRIIDLGLPATRRPLN
ncbi:MAG: hypothetical protein JST84_01260 [Acidobacteria bacterium]|nr:hypothetical protein [Acidobacteriota bacterium]